MISYLEDLFPVLGGLLANVSSKSVQDPILMQWIIVLFLVKVESHLKPNNNHFDVFQLEF
jgi:hypothetical protein